MLHHVNSKYSESAKKKRIYSYLSGGARGTSFQSSIMIHDSQLLRIHSILEGAFHSHLHLLYSSRLNSQKKYGIQFVEVYSPFRMMISEKKDFSIDHTVPMSQPSRIKPSKKKSIRSQYHQCLSTQVRELGLGGGQISYFAFLQSRYQMLSPSTPEDRRQSRGKRGVEGGSSIRLGVHHRYHDR